MPAPTHFDLGRRERQIVEAIFRLGRATVNEVLAALPDPPSYSSVRAMLAKLERKGYVRHIEDGPRYLYLPAVSADRARRKAMQNLIETFFEGSAEQAAVALLRLPDTTVDPAVLEQLAAKIEQARKEGR